MSPLESAIAQMQEEVDSYGQGTANQPAEGSVGWFLLRAAAAGLAYLRRVELLEVSHDAAACDRLYRVATKHFKAAEVPPPAVIDREVLPQ